MIIIGLVGLGKSYFIDVISFFFKDSCKVCVFFGVVVFNVGGIILYFFL